VLKRLGLARALYYRWRQRQAQGQLEDQKAEGVDLYQAGPEEEEAVKRFALEHPRDGYRRLAWMMVDQDVAYLSPSSVYRILDRFQLLDRWKPSRVAGHKPGPPSRPHQVWHTDLMYLWIRGRWYFFIAVLDGFSRFIVHWDLLASMRSAEVVDVVHAAVKKHPGEKPRIVHDNGPQFTGKEFRDLLKRFTLEEIRIRVYHPESNGKIERFHGVLRQEGLSDQDLKHQLQAQEIIGGWVRHYNQERLHASLAYLTPQDWLLGRQQTRLAERKQKLAVAKNHRYQENLKRRQKEVVKDQLGGVAPKPPGFSALTDPVHRGNRTWWGFASNGMNRLPVTGRSGCFPAEPYPHR
jgi:putative transposase